jgi:putative nucleotidyltransferase with HDIG domain
MKVTQELENQLKQILLKYFEKSSWNYKHSLATAVWIKKLMRSRDNEKVLVTAAYLHDIGYGSLISSDYTLEERIAAKKEHGKIGSEEAKKILTKLNYSKEEIKEICHLILIHDELPNLKTRNEILLMEADSLSAIDYERCPSSITEEELKRYFQICKEKRWPKFKTTKGKQFLKQLQNTLECSK